MRWARRAERVLARKFQRPLGLLDDERGTVTAEFAIVLPVVLVVLGLVIGGIAISAHRIALASAAAEFARLEARGHAAEAEARLAQFEPDVEVARETQGVLHCVTLSSHPGAGLLGGIGVSARACAATTDVGEVS